MLATQVLDDAQTPSETPSVEATQELDDAPTPSVGQDLGPTSSEPEPAKLEKSDDVPKSPEAVEPDATAIPGGGLNVGLQIDPAMDPKEKAKSRKEAAASSPAKDLIQVCFGCKCKFLPAGPLP